MDIFYINISYIILIVLVPIIPAYICFKLLKSSASTTGPFQGLSLKLGGAFAGYFAIFAFLYFKLDFKPVTIDSTKNRIWTITGKVLDANDKTHILSNDEQGEGNQSLYKLRVHLDPTDQEIYAGHFSFKFIPRIDDNGQPNFNYNIRIVDESHIYGSSNPIYLSDFAKRAFEKRTTEIRLPDSVFCLGRIQMPHNTVGAAVVSRLSSIN